MLDIEELIINYGDVNLFPLKSDSNFILTGTTEDNNGIHVIIICYDDNIPELVYDKQYKLKELSNFLTTIHSVVYENRKIIFSSNHLLTYHP